MNSENEQPPSSLCFSLHAPGFCQILVKSIQPIVDGCGMKIEKRVDGDWNFGIIRKAPISMDEVFPLQTGMVINLQIPSLNVSAR